MLAGCAPGGGESRAEGAGGAREGRVSAAGESGVHCWGMRERGACGGSLTPASRTHMSTPTMSTVKSASNGLERTEPSAPRSRASNPIPREIAYCTRTVPYLQVQVLHVLCRRSARSSLHQRTGPSSDGSEFPSSIQRGSFYTASTVRTSPIVLTYYCMASAGPRMRRAPLRASTGRQRKSRARVRRVLVQTRSAAAHC